MQQSTADENFRAGYQRGFSDGYLNYEVFATRYCPEWAATVSKLTFSGSGSRALDHLLMDMQPESERAKMALFLEFCRHRQAMLKAFGRLKSSGVTRENLDMEIEGTRKVMTMWPLDGISSAPAPNAA